MYFQCSHSSVAILTGLSGFFRFGGRHRWLPPPPPGRRKQRTLYGLSGKAGVQVVIDHQDAPHEPPPSPRRTLNAPCLPSLPIGTTFHTIARAVLPCESVHYRISARKSPVCLPSTVYKAGSTTSNRELNAPARAWRALPKLTRAFDLPPSIRAYRALPIDCRRTLSAAALTLLCPHLKTVELARSAAERSSALQKHIARHEQPR